MLLYSCRTQKCIAETLPTMQPLVKNGQEWSKRPHRPSWLRSRSMTSWRRRCACSAALLLSSGCEKAKCSRSFRPPLLSSSANRNVACKQGLGFAFIDLHEQQ
jgi:hypothetical protein